MAWGVTSQLAACLVACLHFVALQLIFVDYPLTEQSLHITDCHVLLTFGRLLQILAPSPPPFWFMVLGKYWATGKGREVVFHWTHFSVIVPRDSCLQGWIPLTVLPWIPPCCAWSVQVPCQPIRHQFPSSSIGDNFKDIYLVHQIERSLQFMEGPQGLNTLVKTGGSKNEQTSAPQSLLDRVHILKTFSLFHYEKLCGIPSSKN